MQERPVSGGLIAVERSEVSVTKRCLPIARGCLAVAVGVMVESGVAVPDGHEIAPHSFVIAGAGGPVAPHRGEVTLVGCGDCLRHRPSPIGGRGARVVDGQVARFGLRVGLAGESGIKAVV
jgi:hypothetical protein